MEEMNSTSWHSYPKSFAIGHRLIADIFKEPVIVEEKVDGSQFSFGLFDGELKARTKGATLNLLAPEKMFARAVEVIQRLAPNLRNGWTYRGEYLAKPKHNTLVYSRVPNENIIGFDINTGHEHYLSYEEKAAEFARIGLETVPKIFEGVVEDYTMFREMLETISVLGGQKIEGVVVKNYARFTPDGKAMLGKFVSEDFKEIHNGNWKETNPSGKDFVQRLVEQYTTPARWNKAIHRLRDEGKLEGSPRDIGLIIKEVPDDILSECADELKDKLFEHIWPQIRRGVTHGLPQYYKEQIAKASFESERN